MATSAVDASPIDNNMDPSKEHKVRVLVCGDGGVGKNQLIDKFTAADEKRISTLSTIGIIYSVTLRLRTTIYS